MTVRNEDETFDGDDKEELEPTPYENAYRRTLKDDVETPEAPDPELLDIPDGDTQEVEGLIQAQDEKEHDWKKRYSDLKSYHDRKNNEWLQQQELTEAKLKLAEQKVSAPRNLPKSTEELEEHNQIKVKQLKNRYNDPVKNRNFVVGIDRAKMKLYDVEEEAQQELNTDPKEKEGKVIKKPKSGAMTWDKFNEEKKRSGLEKIVV